MGLIGKSKWPSVTVDDVDKLPLEQLFSQLEIREKREQMKKSVSKFVTKCYKGRYGDEF